MKALITAVPNFHLELNEDIINILIKLSESHYDSTCKSASKEGGFLNGWKNQIKYNEGKLSSDFYNLDLSLKISEDLGTHPENIKKIIKDYQAFIVKIVKESEKLSDHSIQVCCDL
jgi:hypothetical protein